jgi:hypothetical protein
VFDYVKIALALIQLANTFADWARERGQLQAGADAELGRQALAVLRATEWGKAITDRLDAMDDQALDDLTDALGADGPGSGG